MFYAKGNFCARKLSELFNVYEERQVVWCNRMRFGSYMLIVMLFFFLIVTYNFWVDILLPNLLYTYGLGNLSSDNIGAFPMVGPVCVDGCTQNS